MKTQDRTNMPTPVTAIRGDGVGPEVIDAAIQVLNSSGVELEWTFAEAGAGANIRVGDALPEETLRSIRHTRVCLKGPLEAPLGTGHQSADARLRANLGLYATLGQVRSTWGTPTPVRGVDITIIRENLDTEGSERERYADHDGEVVELVERTTRVACERIVRDAFDHAVRTHRSLVTLVHEGASLRLSAGLFARTGRDVAPSYGALKFEEMLVEHAATRLVMNPSRFGVIVTTSHLGNALSGLAAGLVGGSGLIPMMHLGADSAVFEPMHDAALDLVGRGIVNPTATILAGAMMLRHMGEGGAADLVESATRSVIGERKRVTPDLGGRASTAEFAEQVSAVVRSLRSSSAPLL
jgi:isocitrate dehydrogenase (NAD+)